MKTKIFLSLVLLSFQSFAADTFTVASEFSSVSFATIKKQFVVEPAAINGLTGNLDSSGKFNVSVPVGNINTGVSIRDDRVSGLFFNAAYYPTVNITGQFDLSGLKQDITKVTVPAAVSFHGNSKTFNFPVIVTKTKNAITVSSHTPVIVQASDFGIPAENLANLAATVGGLALSDKVPLTVNLVFKK